MSDVADPALADRGRNRVDWTLSQMPVLARIHQRFADERPLRRVQVGGCLPITSEVANLARALTAGGAVVALCASDPSSTQDDAAAALVRHWGVDVFARRDVDRQQHLQYMDRVLATGPRITLDHGGDLVDAIHTQGGELQGRVLAGTEGSSAGCLRLRARAHAGQLAYPVVALNDASTQRLFAHRRGTGPCTLDDILRYTDFRVAGRVFVVAGYGWCGRGIASRARGMGARVLVTEVDPVRALEAVMDGFEVVSMEQAVTRADFVVTATGSRGVVGGAHLERMKDGCVLANAGCVDVEIDVATLRAFDPTPLEPQPGVEVYRVPGGRRIRLLWNGRKVELASAWADPATATDLRLATHALAVAWLVRHHAKLDPRVAPVPREIEVDVARETLRVMEISIDIPGPDHHSRFIGEPSPF